MPNFYYLYACQLGCLAKWDQMSTWFPTLWKKVVKLPRAYGLVPYLYSFFTSTLSSFREKENSMFHRDTY